MSVNVSAVGIGHKLNLNTPISLANDLADIYKVPIEIYWETSIEEPFDDYDKVLIKTCGSQYALSKTKPLELLLPESHDINIMLKAVDFDGHGLDLTSDECVSALNSSLDKGENYTLEGFVPYDWLCIFKENVEVHDFTNSSWHLLTDIFDEDTRNYYGYKELIETHDEGVAKLKPLGCKTIVYYADEIHLGAEIQNHLHLSTKELLDYVINKKFCGGMVDYLTNLGKDVPCRNIDVLKETSIVVSMQDCLAGKWPVIRSSDSVEAIVDMIDSIEE